MESDDVVLTRLDGRWVIRRGNRAGDIHPGSPMEQILNGVVGGLLRNEPKPSAPPAQEGTDGNP